MTHERPPEKGEEGYGLYQWIKEQNAESEIDVKALLLTLDKARESLAECDEAMGYMSEYDIPLCMPDRVKSALEAIAPYAEAIKKVKNHV